MAVVKFELKEEHIKLLKNLHWNISNNSFIGGVSVDEYDIPESWDDNSKYDYIDLVLNGKPEDFNPLEQNEIKSYSDDDKKNYDELFKELPLALSIVLYTGKFETGKYIKKYGDIHWKKK